MQVRQLIWSLAFNTDTSGIEKAEKSVEKMGGTATNVMSSVKRAIAGIGIAATVGMIGRQMIATINTFQQLRAQLNTIEGDAQRAEQAFGWLSRFAATTPFELSQVIGSFVKMRAVGLAPTEKDMLALGDIAAGMGRNIEEFGQAVVAATTGEMEMLKGFGIVAKQEGKTVEFTFKGQKTKIKKDSQEIFKYLVNLGKAEFAGGMAAQAKTIGGAFSNLQDNIAAFYNSVGEAGLSEALTELVRELTGVTAGSKDVAKFLGKSLAIGIRATIDAIRTLKTVIVELSIALTTIAVVGGLYAFGGAIMSVQAGVQALNAALIIQKVLALKAAAAQTLLGLQFALVGIALAGMLLLFDDINTFFEGGDSVIGDFLESLGFKGPEAVQALEDALGGLFIALLLLAALIGGPITLAVALGAALIALVGYVYTFQDEIKAAFENMWNEVSTFFQMLGFIIVHELSTAWNKWLDRGKQRWQEFTDFITRLFDSIVEMITSLPAKAAAAAKDMAKALPGGEYLVGAAGSAADFVGGFFGGGAASPAVDMQRRANQVANNSSTINATVPITVNPPAGADPEQVAIAVQQRMEQSMTRMVDSTASNYAGAVD